MLRAVAFSLESTTFRIVSNIVMHGLRRQSSRVGKTTPGMDNLNWQRELAVSACRVNWYAVRDRLDFVNDWQVFLIRFPEKTRGLSDFKNHHSLCPLFKGIISGRIPVERKLKSACVFVCLHEADVRVRCRWNFLYHAELFRRFHPVPGVDANGHALNLTATTTGGKTNHTAAATTRLAGEMHCSKSRHAALIFISFERKLVTDLHSSELSIPNRSAYPPEYFVAASN